MQKNQYRLARQCDFRIDLLHMCKAGRSYRGLLAMKFTTNFIFKSSLCTDLKQRCGFLESRKSDFSNSVRGAAGREIMHCLIRRTSLLPSLASIVSPAKAFQAIVSGYLCRK